MKEAGRYIGTVFSFALKERPKLHLALDFEVIFMAATEGQGLSNSIPEIHTISGVEDSQCTTSSSFISHKILCLF